MVKYILAKAVGKVEIGDDGYPTGSLRPEKVPDNVEAEFKAYSLDQSQVLIRVNDDTVDPKLFGDTAVEMTALDAKALYEQWQNEHDINCKCFGKSNSLGTHTQLNKPCLCNALAGVCHVVIDETKPKITTDYDAWKAEFDLGLKNNELKSIQDAEEYAKKREKVLAKIASGTIKPTADTSLNDLITLETLTDEEKIEVFNKAKDMLINAKKYQLIKHPLKTHRVPF